MKGRGTNLDLGSNAGWHIVVWWWCVGGAGLEKSNFWMKEWEIGIDKIFHQGALTHNTWTLNESYRSGGL